MNDEAQQQEYEKQVREGSARDAHKVFAEATKPYQGATPLEWEDLPEYVREGWRLVRAFLVEGALVKADEEEIVFSCRNGKDKVYFSKAPSGSLMVQTSYDDASILGTCFVPLKELVSLEPKDPLPSWRKGLPTSGQARPFMAIQESFDKGEVITMRDVADLIQLVEHLGARWKE